jgi:hypothetical protein
MLQDLRYRLQLGKKLKVKLLLAMRDGRNGHPEAMTLIQRRDNLNNRHSTPGVEGHFVAAVDSESTARHW